MVLTNLLMVGLLVLVEISLSFDNAVVLAVMVSHLPTSLQKKALTYGIGGAFLFRILALLFFKTLLDYVIVRFLAAGYLIYLCLNHFFGKGDGEAASKIVGSSFVKTVVMIELADIVFSFDSILASVSVSQKTWVLITGALIGITAMRISSGIFVSIINRYPVIEHIAYGFIGAMGLKMTIAEFY